MTVYTFDLQKNKQVGKLLSDFFEIVTFLPDDLFFWQYLVSLLRSSVPKRGKFMKKPRRVTPCKDYDLIVSYRIRNQIQNCFNLH